MAVSSKLERLRVVMQETIDSARAQRDEARRQVLDLESALFDLRGVRAGLAAQVLDLEQRLGAAMATTAPTRSKLPDERRSISRKLPLPPSEDPGAPRKMYATVSFFEDGRLGEIFLRAEKAGSFASGILDGLAIVMSIALQYGIPLEVLCGKLIGTKFEPAGVTGDSVFKVIKSPLDLIASWLKTVK